jgi:hypothetical protein
MGRSVSYPSDCTKVCFQDISRQGYESDEGDYDEVLGMFDWDDFVADLKDTATGRWTSLEECDEWLGDEDHAILENDFCYIGVSTYCGCAAVWLRSKADDLRDDYYPELQSKANLAEHWCDSIADKFEELFGEYRKIATFSNGEAVFEKIER